MHFLRALLAASLLAATVAACLPPPPREPTYGPGAPPSMHEEIATDDLEALCAEGHEASCDLLGKAPGHGVTKLGELRLTGMGTCFAIAADGLLLTAAHVVNGADAVAVQFGTAEPVEATVVKASTGVDVALLQIAEPTPRFVAIDPATAPALGARVFTVGFPQPAALGMDAKFAEGSVSGVSGLGEEHLMQTSIPVHQGNSGGAVVTEEGRLVAVVVARVNDAAFYNETGALAGAISFATKLAYVAPMLPALAAPPPPLDRTTAIALVKDATCKVFVGKRPRR